MKTQAGDNLYCHFDLNRVKGSLGAVMVHIISDNPGIEKYLKQLESLISEGGGGLHSDLLIKSEDGNLAVETAEEMRPGREIIRLTRKVLLPEDQYEISCDGHEFSVSHPDGCLLSDLQKKLLDVMVGLYNETDKARIYQRDCVYLTLRKHPALKDIVFEGREVLKHVEDWEARFDGNEDEQAVLHDFLAKGFLKTRFLGYSDMVRSTSVSILMPVVDFLNHNWSGASFNVSQNMRQGDLMVDNRQCVSGSRECFAFYGTMDAFDTMVRYDFPDLGAPVVRSVPLDLDFFDHGKIRISANTGGAYRKELPKSIAFLRKIMPNFLEPTQEQEREGVILNLSYLFIPGAALKAPLAMVRVLNHALKHLCERAEITISDKDRSVWVRDAEQKIVAANVSYYARMKAVLDDALRSDPDNAVLKSFQAVVDNHKDKLSAYQPAIEANVA